MYGITYGTYRFKMQLSVNETRQYKCDLGMKRLWHRYSCHIRYTYDGLYFINLGLVLKILINIFVTFMK